VLLLDILNAYVYHFCTADGWWQTECDVTWHIQKMFFRICNAVIFLAPVWPVICSTITACPQATLSSPYWFEMVDYHTFPILLRMLTPTMLVSDMIQFFFGQETCRVFFCSLGFLNQDVCCSPVNMVLECHLKTT